MENTPEIKEFIRENSSLFRYFKEEETPITKIQTHKEMIILCD